VRRIAAVGSANAIAAGNVIGRAEESGFSLIETIVATALLATSIAALGQLFAIAIVNTSGARDTTFATVLAADKMEQLRSLTYAASPASVPVSAAGLAPSPSGALHVNTSGWVDYLDEHGTTIGSDGDVPPGTVYVRRWSIVPLPTDPADALVLQVLVEPRDKRAVVRLVSVRTRTAG
jgi:type II secretory pathway pseudopilin PulG